MGTLYQDQEIVLRDVTERFDKLGIPYMLTGSMALICYSVMRMTNDIDIVIEVKRRDSQRIIDEFEPDYYVPHDRVTESISRKSMFNLLHEKMIVKVDCVIRKDDEFQKIAFSRREKVCFNDFYIWVISRDDLILSKLNWAKDSRSEMQMRDVAGIIRNGYDREYVGNWANKLGVTNLLTECISLLDQNYVDGHDA